MRGEGRSSDGAPFLRDEVGGFSGVGQGVIQRADGATGQVESASNGKSSELRS